MTTRLHRRLSSVIIAIAAAAVPMRGQTATGSEIYYPLEIPEETFTPSGTQKAVATSTDIITLGMPLLTLAGVCVAGDWEGLRQGAYTAALTAGATLLLKYTVSEKRPNLRNNHSFPSGHTAASFATAAFLQRRYGWGFGAPAYALATYVAWGRVFSKNHHWWDVVAGAAIGAGSAYIFTRPWARDHDLKIGAWTVGTHHGLTASMAF